MLAYTEFRMFSSYSLISENVKHRINKTTNFPAFLHRYQNWSLILGEEHRLRVFKHLGLRQKKNMKAGENRIMSSFLV
jgi:hypothetical protein